MLIPVTRISKMRYCPPERYKIGVDNHTSRESQFINNYSESNDSERCLDTTVY